MKLTRILMPALFGLAIFCSCRDQDESRSGLLDSIPADKYYSTDPFQDKFSQIYGEWQVIGTGGGITGAGYAPDFEYLVIKPNAIFGIVRGDSLVATGKIEVQNDPDFDLLIHLISDDNNTENIQIIRDYEKFVSFPSDSMLLYSTCCDRFDTYLRKVK